MGGEAGQKLGMICRWTNWFEGREGGERGLHRWTEKGNWLNRERVGAEVRGRHETIQETSSQEVVVTVGLPQVDQPLPGVFCFWEGLPEQSHYYSMGMGKGPSLLLTLPRGWTVCCSPEPPRLMKLLGSGC